ncbi:MAG: OmpH family outer membrane protein [Ignavibacteriae bacterium]|nr:OmpH family outer membrane protein [Ignavibacteriota bacterium]
MLKLLVKACLLGVVILFLSAAVTSAQMKIGWINSAAIMDKYPEAQDAQHKLDNFVADWQAELAKMQNEWQRKYEEYDKKKLILTDQLRAQAEKELQELDKKIADYRNQKFGQNGELFTKQNELMKPVQNKIFKIVKEIAEEEDYDYVFDKSADIVMLYSNEKYDLTAKVFERLQNFKEKK